MSEGRLERLARDWGVSIDERFETATSLLAYGLRDTTPVVLKVVRQPGDEWRSGEILACFRGEGVARVYAHEPGAVLLERLIPGKALVDLVIAGRDEEATELLAKVVARMSPGDPPDGVATVEDWSKSFGRYIASGGDEISTSLVAPAHRIYLELCAAQTRRRLLHGDLQHYNVLHSADRGCLAIDPKGVVGELEYEVGASLRNPHDCPELLADAAVAERRIQCFASALRLDASRILRWAFSQAVLSAIWSLEDGCTIESAAPALRTAETLRAMIA